MSSWYVLQHSFSIFCWIIHFIFLKDFKYVCIVKKKKEYNTTMYLNIKINNILLKFFSIPCPFSVNYLKYLVLKKLFAIFITQDWITGLYLLLDLFIVYLCFNFRLTVIPFVIVVFCFHAQLSPEKAEMHVSLISLLYSQW